MSLFLRRVCVSSSRPLSRSRLLFSTSSSPSLPKPLSPNFGSGPTKKRPGWSAEKIAGPHLGRSHRAKIGKDMLGLAIQRTKEVLGVPDDYHVGIVPASDTGAYELAMWNFLGQRPVDVCHWESFGSGWFKDAQELKLENVTSLKAEYGEISDLAQANPEHDICFTFNGTTSGVKVPDCDWISADRTGLTLNDATSAVFAQEMDFSKLDVTTYSWQKALGGEGAHGMLILSPRAVERLEQYTPDRPLPKIFRIRKGDSLNAGIFTGATINTPSMLCVADYLDALEWVTAEGGVEGMKARSDANLAVIEEFVEANSDAFGFLCQDKATRSNTSVCLTVAMDGAKLKDMIAYLSAENVAHDIGAYRDAPDGLRIWCGPTVETSDVKLLMPWLKAAYDKFV